MTWINIEQTDSYFDLDYVSQIEVIDKSYSNDPNKTHFVRITLDQIAGDTDGICNATEKVFFGTKEECERVRDKILANEVVIVI